MTTGIIDLKNKFLCIDTMMSTTVGQGKNERLVGVEYGYTKYRRTLDDGIIYVAAGECINIDIVIKSLEQGRWKPKLNSKTTKVIKIIKRPSLRIEIYSCKGIAVYTKEIVDYICFGSGSKAAKEIYQNNYYDLQKIIDEVSKQDKYTGSESDLISLSDFYWNEDTF